MLLTIKQKKKTLKTGSVITLHDLTLKLHEKTKFLFYSLNLWTRAGENVKNGFVFPRNNNIVSS